MYCDLKKLKFSENFIPLWATVGNDVSFSLFSFYYYTCILEILCKTCRMKSYFSMAISNKV